jgi:D-beta-D-heptose 7-phosphate kinase/D-beta-D-heptose 1-phosphate adenosyltransferase
MIYTHRNISKLIASLNALKRKSKVIGFTHGAFDLFHDGHLHLLKEARKQCDYLLVGVNTDASIKIYKGGNRPVFNQKYRAELLDNLKLVDAVLIIDFAKDNDRYSQLYQQLSPDKIFIGPSFGFMNEIKQGEQKLKSFELIVVEPLINSTTDVLGIITSTTPPGVDSARP